MAENEFLTRSSGTQGRKALESGPIPKVKKSVLLDARTWQVLEAYCMKRHGSCYRFLGREVSNAIGFYVAAVDKQQSFTILSIPIKLGGIARRRLNALIDAILKVAHEQRTTIISDSTVSELIKNELGIKSNSRVKHYKTLLLQHDMERTTEVSSDTGTIEVVYNVATLERVSSDNSHFKDINRRKANYRVEIAGQHSQDEDQSRPENKRAGLRGE
jgi:hypothetical protein